MINGMNAGQQVDVYAREPEFLGSLMRESPEQVLKIMAGAGREQELILQRRKFSIDRIVHSPVRLRLANIDE